MPRALLSNNARTTLSASLTAAATSFTVTSGGGAKFPNPTGGDYFYATLLDASNVPEIIKVTARSTDTFTIVRAQDSTAARAFASGATVTLSPIAAFFNELRAELLASVVSAVSAITAAFLVITGGARTTPVPVAFSTTPAIDASTSNVFYIGALTANVVSSTINNPADGQTINIRVVQDAVGGRSFALPANVKATGALQTTANSATWLILTYVQSASQWEGAWSQVPA